MDFGTLLHKAQKNEVSKKEPIRYYSTKFEPPKKEQRNKAQVAVNVRKFLEKKEQEEKLKRLEAQKKKEELLALRSKDKKAVKRVNVMLKRTKSANQSVIEDAVDSVNTAVTLAGPAQPDEDDYGYVSQEASAFYSKMMEKYNNMPEEPPKFSLEKKKVSTNLSSTKDRVKAALEREKEEAMMPHKRKRKHKEDGDSTVGSERRQEVEEEEKPEIKKVKIDKPKPKAPPPMNFADLLKLAEKKQFEPIVIEKKPKEDENPLTKKQKREMDRVREWQERKNEKSKPPSNNQNPQSNSGKPSSGDKEKMSDKPGNNVKISKLGSSSKLAEALTKDKTKPAPKSEKVPDKLEPENKPKKIDWGPKHPGAGRMNISNNGTTSNSFKTSASNNSKLSQSSSSSKVENAQRPNSNPQKPSPVQRSSSNITLKPPSSGNVPSRPLSASSSLKQSKPIPNRGSSNALKENKSDISDRKEVIKAKPKEGQVKEMMKPKQFPPADLRPKQFPPADVRRKPMNKPPKMKINKGRILDDDEEEDSEMDDFIDDGPEEEEDYSKYISEIFGYNKSKYADYEDDDDDMMESTFAQQMKEEVISTKMGIMEDLEDMKLEEEHKKRKMLMKKKLSKRK